MTDRIPSHPSPARPATSNPLEIRSSSTEPAGRAPVPVKREPLTAEQEVLLARLLGRPLPNRTAGEAA